LSFCFVLIEKEYGNLDQNQIAEREQVARVMTALIDQNRYSPMGLKKRFSEHETSAAASDPFYGRDSIAANVNKMNWQMISSPFL
jgi:hypothetical protein